MKIKIISWNLNGIRAVAKKGLWRWAERENSDIYCFQETKAKSDQVEVISEIENQYMMYWNSAAKAGYSGVATFTKLEPKSVIVGDRDNDWDDEGRVLITKFHQFTLLNVYFPNGKKDKGRLNYKMEFYDYFLNYINKLRDQGEKIIFCGDVNTAHNSMDLARPKENENVSGFLSIEREWLDELNNNGYIDTFRYLNPDKISYTWWSARSGARKRDIGWRIDYFFVSEDLKDKVKSAFIMPEVIGSDHCPVGIELEI